MPLGSLIADLFDLEARIAPVSQRPAERSSQDCSAGDCTTSCAGCEP
jgi:hypothetical protein